MLDNGRHIFRHDTFGNEAFWGGGLRLHEAIAGANHGGVGGGVSPATALAVGLKVDIEALPKSLQKSLGRGEVDLNDPATTLALLMLYFWSGWTYLNNQQASGKTTHDAGIGASRAGYGS